MSNLRIVDILLGLSIMCMALAAKEGLLMPLILAVMCTVLAGANRHYELEKISKA